MDWLMKLIQGTNLPTANLADPAAAAAALTVPDSVWGATAPDPTIDKTAADALTGRAYDEWENPYLMDIEEHFSEESRRLESSLAARGMLNSTQADESRNRLADAKARATADARLRFETVMGGERRDDASTAANIMNLLFGQDMAGAGFDRDTGLKYGGEKRENLELVANILGNLFQQNVAGTELGLDKVGAAGQAIEQAEGMDLQRRAGALDRKGRQEDSQQRIYTNMLQLLMTPENINQMRMGNVQNPLSMLLSALSGVNVAPGTVGQLQMPAQRPPGPGAGELFGSLLGSLIGAGGQMAGGYWAGRDNSGKGTG